MKTEIELLREIANEAKLEWDKERIDAKACHLKNLLTDHTHLRYKHDEKTGGSVSKSCANCVFTGVVDHACAGCGYPSFLLWEGKDND